MSGEKSIVRYFNAELNQFSRTLVSPMVLRRRRKPHDSADVTAQQNPDADRNRLVQSGNRDWKGRREK
jgi:hypothetical protein